MSYIFLFSVEKIELASALIQSYFCGVYTDPTQKGHEYNGKLHNTKLILKQN